MSEENVEVRREQFEAFMDALNARDFDSLAEFLDPEATFDSVLAASEGKEAYTGIGGLRKWAAEVDATWEDWHQEVVDFRDVAGDQAVAVIRVTGRARGSGVPLDSRTGNVLTWRHGKGWRNRAYSDPREAFEAVGLRE
jgi:ketosteroid isomerase-like protein